MHVKLNRVANFSRLTSGTYLAVWICYTLQVTECIKCDQELIFFVTSFLQVHVVASLPCYSPKNVNMQRGSGVFDRSIRGLKKLNDLGYGKSNSGLKLDLVFNPVGGYLPPEQVQLGPIAIILGTGKKMLQCASINIFSGKSSQLRFCPTRSPGMRDSSCWRVRALFASTPP